MKNLKKTGLALLGFVLLGLSACSKDEENNTVMTKDITDVAIADPQFSTLVSALTKANLSATVNEVAVNR